MSVIVTFTMPLTIIGSFSGPYMQPMTSKYNGAINIVFTTVLPTVIP